MLSIVNQQQQACCTRKKTNATSNVKCSVTVVVNCNRRLIRIQNDIHLFPYILKVIIMDHSRRKIAGSCIITVGIML